METLALILRTSCLSFLLLFVVLAIRDGWKHSNTKFSILAAVTIAALFVQGPSLPIWVAVPLRLIDACNIAFVWWSCLALLEEDFELRPMHWLGLVAYGASTLPYRFALFGFIDVPPDWYRSLSDIVTFILVAHLIWKAAEGYREDLIEKRRGLRLVFILGCALAIAIAIFGQNLLYDRGFGAHSLTLTAAVTLPLAFALNIWVLRLHPEIFLFQPTTVAQEITPNIRPQDKALYERLIAVTETERVWAEPGLTIGALASKVGAPEHQLRALINRGMGYRNFTGFLNSYRLAYAKTVLADAEHARLPVLTIAMDAGFGSLAPFNRAFKASEGVTPTEYRAEKLSDQN